MARAKKEQIIIDLANKEIKGTTKAIIDKITELLSNEESLTKYYKLNEFKVVKSLSADKEKVKDRFKMVGYKTKKVDILEYLETIKDSNAEAYNKYTKLVEEVDFIVVNKMFNDELITTDEAKETIRAIVIKNAELKQKADEEKKRLQEIRKANREARQKAKETR